MQVNISSNEIKKIKIPILKSIVQKQISSKITESNATIFLLMGPEWQEEVRMNETVELDKKSYIIVDINSQAVVLKPDVADPESADRITVQKPTQEEQDALKAPEQEMNPELYNEGMPMDGQGFF